MVWLYFKNLLCFWTTRNRINDTTPIRKTLRGTIDDLKTAWSESLEGEDKFKRYWKKLPKIDIGMPTVEMNFSPNTSPFAGLDGKYVTSTKLEERLLKEAERDVSLVVEKDTIKDSWIVKGRGELHLSILIENMRRENYESQVSKAKVVLIK